MVKTLQFNMSVPTPYVFMKRFLQAAESDRQVLYSTWICNSIWLFSFYPTICFLAFMIIDGASFILSNGAVLGGLRHVEVQIFSPSGSSGIHSSVLTQGMQTLDQNKPVPLDLFWKPAHVSACQYFDPIHASETW